MHASTSAMRLFFSVAAVVLLRSAASPTAPPTKAPAFKKKKEFQRRHSRAPPGAAVAAAGRACVGSRQDSMAAPGNGKLGAPFTPSLFERAPYKQQAVKTHSIICQMKTEPSSWTTAAASSFFTSRAPITALASTSFANPAFLLLAVVLASALRGVQSPGCEKTEISLL
jgi:hypothetical protein